MARDLTTAVETALAATAVRPVLIGRLDFATDPIKAWNGPGIFAPSGSGDAALDGETFTRVEAIVGLSTVTEDQGIGQAVTLTVTAHDLDEEALRQVVRDKRQWRGQPAYLWIGLLEENQATVIGDPFRIRTGVMTRMVVRRTAEASVIEITIDRDLSNARAAPWRWIDHTRVWSADTFSTFMTKLANRPQGLGTAVPRPLRGETDDVRRQIIDGDGNLTDGQLANG